jgi:hypothetical protein
MTTNVILLIDKINKTKIYLKNVEDKQTKEMEKLINEIFLTECV